MKVIRVNEWGKPVQFEEIPQPKAADDEALVRVHSASINPLDSAIVSGYIVFMATPPLTHLGLITQAKWLRLVKM